MSEMATSYHALNIHVVFATKGRVPLIADSWIDEMHAYIGGSVRSLGGFPRIVGGIGDHVHLLVSLRATHCVADFVREIKKSSSSWATSKAQNFAWQVGYGVFSVSPNDIPHMTAYIAKQAEHHLKVSSADELRALLTEAGIDWDERFFK